ncbi:hypothetical protein C7B76_01250 [filamentous cyanobacterium CCP2]|nr:hypothetical protein C7B76_01250 [filamentous cyanobacterium CCP2]
MGALMQSFHWAASALGAVETWPQSLRFAIRICLQSPCPMMIAWGADLVLIYNDAWQTAFHTELDLQGFGKPAWQVWSDNWYCRLQQRMLPNHWCEIGVQLEQVLATGQSAQLDDVQLFLERSGYLEEVYYTYSHSPIVDEAGQVRGVLTVAAETTQRVMGERRIQEVANEREHVEEALRESQTMFENFMSHMPGSAFIKDEQGRYVYANPAVLKLAKRDITEIIGKTDFDLVPAAIAEQFQANDRAVMATNQVVETLETLPLGDEEHYWMTLKFPILLPSGQRLLGGMTFDITERKQAEAERLELLKRERAAREQAEAANRIKDEFLAVLSHELRSPLNPILGWSQLLRNRNPNPTMLARGLEVIERNAKLQTQLIGDLLDISRILRGKLNLSVAPVNLTTTIESAIETIRLAAEAKNIQVVRFLDAHVGQVSGDAARLQQIVWNLLSNAIKFTPAGGRAEIYLKQVNNEAELQVKDTGKGIDPEFLPFVFESFRQADSTITRKFGGLGLGLAIVRYLVELHGGTVWVNSPGEGKGAIFTVRLPLMQTSPAALIRNTSQNPASNLQGIRILVVEDERDTREFLTFVLEQAGANVTTASSAIEALNHFNQHPPDLLLSDIAMPEMDGYTLIQRIRTLPPEQGGQVPAIALTAHAGEASQNRATAAGFDQHIAKPIESMTLIQIIESQWKRMEE